MRVSDPLRKKPEIFFDPERGSVTVREVSHFPFSHNNVRKIIADMIT